MIGIAVLIISYFILIAPKYIYVPYKGILAVDRISNLNGKYNKYEQRISWDWVLQRSLPVILM